MNEFSVLVKSIENCPEEYELCSNCGSNLMRILNKWVILKDEYCVKEQIPKVMLGDIEFLCAVCGKIVSGHSFYDKGNIEVIEWYPEGFGTREEAEEHLRWLERKKE